MAIHDTPAPQHPEFDQHMFLQTALYETVRDVLPVLYDRQTGVRWHTEQDDDKLPYEMRPISKGLTDQHMSCAYGNITTIVDNEVVDFAISIEKRTTRSGKIPGDQDVVRIGRGSIDKMKELQPGDVEILYGIAHNAKQLLESHPEETDYVKNRTEVSKGLGRAVLGRLFRRPEPQ
jgi:hypothetical protein